MILRDSPVAVKESIQRDPAWARTAQPVVIPLHRLRPRVRIAHLRPGLSMPRRVIVDHELLLAVAGRADFRIGGDWYRVDPGDVLSIPAAQEHQLIDLGVPGAAGLAVHFDWAPGIPDDAALPTARRPWRPAAQGWSLPPVHLPAGSLPARTLGAALRACARAFRRDDPWAEWSASQRLAAGLLPLLRAAVAGTAARDPRLGDLLGRLSDDLAFPWDAGAIATAAGRSPGRCRAWFRAGTGLSPLAWLRQARIDRARTLLEETGLPVQRIAAAVGFADPLHFSRVFHRATGRPPSALRS